MQMKASDILQKNIIDLENKMKFHCERWGKHFVDRIPVEFDYYEVRQLANDLKDVKRIGDDLKEALAAMNMQPLIDDLKEVLAQVEQEPS